MKYRTATESNEAVIAANQQRPGDMDVLVFNLRIIHLLPPHIISPGLLVEGGTRNRPGLAVQNRSVNWVLNQDPMPVSLTERSLQQYFGLSL